MQSEERFLVFRNGRPVDVPDLDALQQELSAKSEPMLRREAYMAATASSNLHLKAALAAQMELDRRSAEAAHARAERLSKKTTWLSIAGGALAALVGAGAGALFTLWLGG